MTSQERDDLAALQKRVAGLERWFAAFDDRGDRGTDHPLLEASDAVVDREAGTAGERNGDA